MAPVTPSQEMDADGEHKDGGKELRRVRSITFNLGQFLLFEDTFFFILTLIAKK